MSFFINFFRRNVFIVNKNFQLRYGFILSLFSLFLGSLTLFFVYKYAIGTDEIVISALSKAGNIKNFNKIIIFFQNQHEVLLIKLIILTVFSSLIFFIIGLIISNRIYGPIYAIRRHLSKIHSLEDLDNKINLRANDEFEELAKELNRVMLSIKKSSK